MSHLKKREAHLLVAAIRVLENRDQRPPTPGEISDLLNLSESTIRLHLNSLSDLGIVSLVQSAFELHAEIKDYLLLEDLSDEAGPEISEDLAAFDRKKEEEAKRMANLFDSGEHEEQRQDRLHKMDRELKEFKGRKPANPFGED
jgi:DNA-binding transcriptional ArsR family regulator